MIQHPILRFMKAYDEEAPYQVDWNGQTETTLPFVIAGPLRFVEVGSKGESIELFDPGAMHSSWTPSTATPTASSVCRAASLSARSIRTHTPQSELRWRGTRIISTGYLS